MIQPVVSAAAQELYDALSPTWTDQDETYNWALLYLCDALTTPGLQPVNDYAMDKGDRQGWTTLLDLNAIPDNALGYLAQFVGVEIPNNYTPAQARSLILNRPSWQRGTPASIIAAVQAQLVGSKRVVFTERDTSPYHATLNTYLVQTPSVPNVLAAIAANKPGGLIIAHVVINSATFAQVQTSVAPGTFTERKLVYPTFGDVLNYVP